MGESMIHITTDIDALDEIARNDLVFKHISDDNSIRGDSIYSDKFTYLAANEGSELMGFFAISAINSICYEIHTVMHPKTWGRSLKYAKEVIVWIFENTPCKKLITFVPADNPQALSLAINSGMEKEGILKKSFLKNGVLLDQHILGVGSDLCQ